MKPLGVCYWYVKVSRCGCVEHGLEYITFHVQNYIVHLAALFWSPVGSQRATWVARICETYCRQCLMSHWQSDSHLLGLCSSLDFSQLTHLPLVPHICISEWDQHWFRQWLVVYSAPSHYLYQCWFQGCTKLKSAWGLNFKINFRPDIRAILCFPVSPKMFISFWVIIYIDLKINKKMNNNNMNKVIIFWWSDHY